MVDIVSSNVSDGVVRTLLKPTDEQFAGSSFGSISRAIIISGSKTSDTLIDSLIVSVDIEETSRGLSKAVIEFFNDNLTITDSELLQSGLKVEIWTGYSDRALVKRGTFYSVKIQHDFDFNSDFIRMTCYGQEWPLSITERRQVYTSLKDSKIAENIAIRNNLLFDVEDTVTINESVAQIAMTDMQFLEERARLYGYDVYVEEGVLHFHAPRFLDSGLKLYYKNGDNSHISAVDIEVDPWFKGVDWEKSGIDRVTGETWSFTSSPDDLDGVASKIIRSQEGGFKRARDLFGKHGVPQKRYIINDGHNQTALEGKRQVQSFNRATEWIVLASCKTVGIEAIKPRIVVELVGLGRHVGKYYVKCVRHLQNDRSYFTWFKLTRPGTGISYDSTEPSFNTTGTRIRKDVTGNSKVVSEAEVG